LASVRPLLARCSTRGE